MPEHTSFFSYLVAMFPALGENMSAFGQVVLRRKPSAPTARSRSWPASSSCCCSWCSRSASASRWPIYDKSVIPETKLTLRTFFEVFVGYWYGTMKDMMGPKRAKRYFPLVGSLACFILFSNMLGLIPGFSPPTSNWNITMGCAVLVFVMFNYYGFKENGLGYLTHLFGPYIGWWGIPINMLLFVDRARVDAASGR